jgi:hypothetical protein
VCSIASAPHYWAGSRTNRPVRSVTQKPECQTELREELSGTIGRDAALKRELATVYSSLRLALTSPDVSAGSTAMLGLAAVGASAQTQAGESDPGPN